MTCATYQQTSYKRSTSSQAPHARDVLHKTCFRRDVRLVLLQLLLVGFRAFTLLRRSFAQQAISGLIVDEVRGLFLAEGQGSVELRLLFQLFLACAGRSSSKSRRGEDRRALPDVVIAETSVIFQQLACIGKRLFTFFGLGSVFEEALELRNLIVCLASKEYRLAIVLTKTWSLAPAMFSNTPLGVFCHP